MSKFNLNSSLQKYSARYQELFENIGDQLILRLNLTPKSLSTKSSFNFNTPPIDNSTFKKLAGFVTIIYFALISILSFSLVLAYTFWPEERLHHTNLIFLIVICALIFGICLLSFCIYARIYKVDGQIRSFSPKFDGNLDGMDSLGSVAYGRNVKINITNHPGGYNKFVENVPNWENNYSDLQDDARDYDEIRKQQGLNRANLQFLKHID